MLVDAAKHGDVEIPYFCYEPKLGHPVGACRMCLVEIEGIPKLQTSCSTPVKDGMVVHTADRPRPPRPERGRRVPARQPPARLPGVRQGRRVPAPGHHLRLGPRALALHRAQAPLREAARALAAGRDRPRALHPLLPLRALLAGDRRGLPADLRRARRAHVRRHPRRPPVRGAVQRQHHRAVPGRRADLAALPLPRPPVGHRGRRRHLHAVPVAVQRHLHGARREGPARARARATHEVDDGWLCDKGRFAYQAIHVDERITAPLVRDGGELRPVSWERALEAAGGLAKHRGRVGTLVGGQATNEEGFLLQRLLREGLDSHDIDSRAARASAGRAGPRAGRPGAPGHRPRPRVRPHRARARLRAARRRADPRPADPQGRAPPRRQARGRHAPARARSTRTPGPSSATRPARRPRSCRRPRSAELARSAATISASSAQLLRDGGEDVVIVWGERLGADAAGAPARARRTPRAGRPRRRRAARGPRRRQRPRPARGRRAARRGPGLRRRSAPRRPLGAARSPAAPPRER